MARSAHGSLVTIQGTEGLETNVIPSWPPSHCGLTPMG